MSLKSIILPSKRKILHAFFVLSIFLIISIIMLYPGSTKPFDGIFGAENGPGDSLVHTFLLWWTHHSVYELHSNPLYMTNLFYPNSEPMTFVGIPFYQGILVGPIHTILGLNFTYNFIVISSFVFGGYGAYLLCNHFTKNRFASLIGGVIFTFAPYHLSHLEHLNLVPLQGIPFFILFLFYMKENDKKFSFLYGGIALAFASFFGDLHYLLFLGIFTIIFVIYFSIFNWREIVNKSFISRLIACFIILIVLGAPLFINILENTNTEFHHPSDTSWWYSADLIGFFIPPENNQIFKNSVDGIYDELPNINSQKEVYVGSLVLSIVIFSLIKFRKENRFWYIIALVFGLLSLGPLLKAAGQQISFFDDYMPFTIISQLMSPIATFRTPVRFYIIAVVAMSVISAITLGHILDKIKKNQWKVLIVSLLILIILVEYNSLPVPFYEDPKNDFYEKIGNEKEEFTVLDLGWYAIYSDAAYFATIHEKPLMAGWPERLPLGVGSDYVNIPIVHQTRLFEDLESKNTEKFLSYDSQKLSENLSQANLCAFDVFKTKYIILHKGKLGGPTNHLQLNDYLKGVLGENVYEDNRITAFVYDRNKNQCPQNYFGYLTSHDYSYYNLNNMPSWGSDEWVMPIYSNTQQTIKVGLNFVNLGDPTKLQFFQSGKLIFEKEVLMNQYLPIKTEILLQEGKNEYYFRLSGGPRLTIFFPDGQMDNYLSDVLSAMWKERDDLRGAFPEVSNKEFENIKKWASETGWNEDPRLSVLTPQGQKPQYEGTTFEYNVSDSFLLDLWNESSRLRSIAPEVPNGDYTSLKNWAKGDGNDWEPRFFPFIPKGEIPEHMTKPWILD